MNAPALISATLLWGLIHPAYKPTTTKVYGEGEWVLTVQTDNFTKETRCTLVNHHGWRPDVTVVPGAFVFHFSPNLETTDAWYKIEDEPARASRADLARLISAGSLNNAERLDNSAEGRVVIPFEIINSADLVAIKPSGRAPIRRFHLGQARSLITTSHNFICTFPHP